MEYNEKERKLTGLELQGAVVALLIAYNGTHDKDHSIQYTLEDALTRGIEAMGRSKKHSAETQNRKKFEAEIGADPTVVLDPERMARLCRKYGIGGTAVAALTTDEEAKTA